MRGMMRRLFGIVGFGVAAAAGDVSFGSTVERIGYWGIVGTLLAAVITVLRIQIKRSETSAASARSDCDTRIAAAVASKNVELLGRDLEIARLRRLLGVAAAAIHPANAELARMLRVDAQDPPPTPAYGVPVTPHDPPAGTP